LNLWNFIEQHDCGVRSSPNPPFLFVRSLRTSPPPHCIIRPFSDPNYELLGGPVSEPQTSPEDTERQLIFFFRLPHCSNAQETGNSACLFFFFFFLLTFSFFFRSSNKTSLSLPCPPGLLRQTPELSPVNPPKAGLGRCELSGAGKCEEAAIFYLTVALTFRQYTSDTGLSLPVVPEEVYSFWMIHVTSHTPPASNFPIP